MDSSDVTRDRSSVEDETRILRRLQTAMADAEAALARRMDINLTDLAAMTHLSFAPRPIGPLELSGRLGITPGATTDLVDRLERAGHLERRRDTVDRRRVQLHPTATAVSQVADELSPLVTALDDVARTLSETERDAVRRYLAAALAAYQSFTLPPDEPPGPTRPE